MLRLVYYLLLLFLFTGCNLSLQPKATIAYNKWDKEMKIVYLQADSLNQVHYIVYDSLHRIKEKAWTQDTVLYYVSPQYVEPDTTSFYHCDWFERYYDDGSIYQKGYAGYENEFSFQWGYHSWKEYEEYTPEGWMSLKFKGFTFWMVYYVEEFYPNGQLKEISGSELDYIRNWDEEGNLQEEHTFRDLPVADPEMPGFDYILTVITTRQYYPSGRLKAIKLSKRYPESVTCPCGEWIYYDEQGKIIHREDYPPCDSYHLECDDI